MDTGDAEIVALLRQSLPEAWDRAVVDVQALRRRTAYRSWPDRARSLDIFFWSRARTELTAEAVTLIVNRHAGAVVGATRVAAFTRYCRSVVTALLLDAEPPAGLAEPAALLTWLLSRHSRQRALAMLLVERLPTETLHRTLIAYPGYALLLLTLHNSDTALSLTARDAFHAAMQGST